VSDSGFGDFALLDLFRAELETHVPALNEGLLALEKDPGQARHYEALMRAAHSVKGAARIVGVEAAARVAHVLEDCFVAAQKGQLTLGADAVDVLLRGVDALGRIGQASRPDENAVGGPDALARLLDDLAAVRSGGLPAASPAEVPLPPAAPVPLSPEGDLDAATADALRGELSARLDDGVVRLDLGRVRRVGPGGLALLDALARAAARRPVPPRLELVNAAGEVRELLRLTRLDRSFAVTPPGA
jgi:two-component system sensor histidine kinase and response regulator WspE